MQNLTNINKPTKKELLVVFSDLSGFSRYSRGKSDNELFQTMSEYAEFTGKIIEAASGKVVKYIGDSILFVFPEDRIDEAVVALKSLKDTGDNWLKQRDIPARHIIKAHFGSVVCGPLGTESDKRFDIYGETVNIAALTASQGLALTAQVFRKLNSVTRKLFKKHTPPITYIQVEANHARGYR
ncbi:MAG: adenylate/guanylate cyclase domain-containing protein [Elusimicrobiales bacterium]|nr:adenylate/guanylate cyclase domain-containing protein [Elusimicrobiales bacterium]MCK5584054.1 adenylate/guanylate cyclase domain-containing protein [Elusimicrobiales bacterium]